MKILFFTRLFYPHIGGVEKHIEKLSENLIRKGYKITVITTKYDNSLEDKVSYKNIDIVRFSQPEMKIIGMFYSWWWLLMHSSLIKENDIIHVHDVFIWYWPFRLLFPKKEVYTTFHGRWGKYPISIADKLQKKIGAKFSRGIICVGDYITKNYGIKADVVTYGAVDPVAGNGKKDEKSVVYVGRLDKDIALHIIFEVFKKLKGFKISFCGEGELSYEANLYGKVLGFVDPKPYYKKSKFCFASGYLTIMEALANHSLVFVAYDNPLQRDYYELAPFKNHIVCSLSANELYDKLIYYQKNPKLANVVINNGFEWVKDQTWESLAKKYIDLWESKKSLESFGKIAKE